MTRNQCPKCGATDTLALTEPGFIVQEVQCSACEESGPVLPGTTLEEAIAIFIRARSKPVQP